MSSISLQVDRAAALTIAKEHLERERGIDPSLYQTASVSLMDNGTDVFLQRVIGRDRESEFLNTYDFDLFYWKVRFFRPGEKEEFRLYIGSRSGRVIQFNHVIDETASRPETTQERAREVAEQFLTNKVGVKLEDYLIKDEVREAKENRLEFAFTWKHKNVEIGWDKLPEGGKARLLVGATVSGDEVIAYTKNDLFVPDAFSRFMDREMEVGRNLSLFFSLGYLLLTVAMMVQLIRSRHHLAMRTTRPVLTRIGIMLAILGVMGTINHFENIVMEYPTSQDYQAFWMRVIFSSGVSSVLSAVAFVLMGLAAESAHEPQPLPLAGRGSWLIYARSTFLSRSVALTVIQGCLLACILLGVQALLFKIGEQYFGVWAQEPWLTEFSGSYWPFLAALFIGLRASLTEETVFRVFAIHWLQGRFKGVWLPVLLASLLWGFGHSGYPVFPMWFRGVEVTILGLLFSWAYLRFGLITVLVAHYLFDAFWSSAGSLFTPSASIYFWSAIGVLGLPLVWAGAAWLYNKSSDLLPINWMLNPAQGFHMKVLRAYIEQAMREGASIQSIKADCSRHSWDPAVVEKAFEGHENKDRDT